MSLPRQIIIVDLEEQPFAFMVEGSEIMFTIGIIVCAEGVEVAHGDKDALHERLSLFMHAIGVHERSPTNAMTAELVI